MKKSVICLSLAALMMGANAFAAEYDMEENTVSGIEGDTYQTVLIMKADETFKDDDIVYVGQSDGESLFSSAVIFGLKADPEDGLYNLKLGGKQSGEAADVKRFYIGMPITTGDAKYDVSFAEEDGSMAFGWEDVDAGGYSSFLVKLNDRVYGYEIGPQIADGTIVNVGFKLTGITDEISGFDAYLSANRIGQELKDYR